MLDSMPPLTEDMRDPLRAWHELESERVVQWVVTPASAMQFIGPIPWRALDQWAQRHGYDWRAHRLLVDVIGYLDQQYMARQASERRTQAKGK